MTGSAFRRFKTALPGPVPGACGGFADLKRAILCRWLLCRETVQQALATRENQGNLAPVIYRGRFLWGRGRKGIGPGSDFGERSGDRRLRWFASGESCEILERARRKESGEPLGPRDMLVAVFKEPDKRDSDASSNPGWVFPGGVNPTASVGIAARAVRRHSKALFHKDIDREVRGSRALKCKRRDRRGAG
jgi:hypothetical protein